MTGLYNLKTKHNFAHTESEIFDQPALNIKCKFRSALTRYLSFATFNYTAAWSTGSTRYCAGKATCLYWWQWMGTVFVDTWHGHFGLCGLPWRIIVELWFVWEQLLTSIDTRQYNSDSCGNSFTSIYTWQQNSGLFGNNYWHFWHMAGESRSLCEQLHTFLDLWQSPSGLYRTCYRSTHGRWISVCVGTDTRL